MPHFKLVLECQTIDGTYHGFAKLQLVYLKEHRNIFIDIKYDTNASFRCTFADAH